MGQLNYIANVSVDGYMEDAQGNFDWGAPGDEVFSFITDLLRSSDTYLYGRRMYETMAVWETDPALAAQSAPLAEFARVWQSAEKVVYSTTLDDVSTSRTRVERDFDADAVRALKSSVTGDIDVGGANLAAHAFKAGLVDECQLFIYPVAVGSGKAALPRDMRVQLELLDERRFDNSVVYLRYRVTS
jgi:dihydrofolate reductase